MNPGLYPSTSPLAANTLARPATPWPILNPSGSRGQYFKIDSPLQSNKLLNPLGRRPSLTLHFDYNQLQSPAADLILWFRPTVKMLDCAAGLQRENSATDKSCYLRALKFCAFMVLLSDPRH